MFLVVVWDSQAGSVSDCNIVVVEYVRYLFRVCVCLIVLDNKFW